MNGKNIFDELSQKQNDVFSNFSKTDLEYLLKLIIDYKLSLRNKLDIDERETFGLEIECENANWEKIRKEVPQNWTLEEDKSLYNGAEIKSPILTDNKNNWDMLKNVCDMLSKYSNIGLQAGGHVHVDTKALQNKIDSLVNFMKLWGAYEDVIFRFGYGEFIGPRPLLISFARPIKNDFANLSWYYETGELKMQELLHYLSEQKYVAVNFKHYHNFKTLEFRSPNGSLNPVIWQNNVNLFVKMLLYSSSSRYDKDKIAKKLDTIFISEETDKKVCIEDALEFVDLVFNNNLDKIYFLRQYIKSFEDTNEYKRTTSFCK